MSYGYFPAGKVTHGHLSKIKPCFSLTARVLHFKTVAKGKELVIVIVIIRVIQLILLLSKLVMVMVTVAVYLTWSGLNWW